MLDFYLIPDSEPTPRPEKVDELEYIGGIDEVAYTRLIKKGIIENRYEYYSDFRWSSKEVKQIAEYLKNKPNDDSDINILKTIIERTLNSKTGIISLCD